MKVMILAMSMAVLSNFFGHALASGELPREWNYAKIRADDSLTVELNLSRDGRSLRFLRTWLDGKRVKIPTADYQDIVRPHLQSVQVLACFTTPLSTCSTLRISFDDSGSDIAEWWEPPEVSFMFRDGGYRGRSIRRRVSATRWVTDLPDGSSWVEEEMQRPEK